MAIKNAKSRDKSNPYEIWEAGDWEWRVLKFYSNDTTDPYARVFCAVKSPFTYGGFDLGDVYYRDITTSAERTYRSPDME